MILTVDNIIGVSIDDIKNCEIALRPKQGDIFMWCKERIAEYMDKVQESNSLYTVFGLPSAHTSEYGISSDIMINLWYYSKELGRVTGKCYGTDNPKSWTKVDYSGLVE